ncbi:M48 family metallopeptidase [Piscibacillus salipiscarius]|uniref:M48 family metallopeptidase n=1 Tax=Piscibacillus salipiscarius TaxID=299480 RepID=UPI002436F2F8|nr:M48 family metallopeptidase [Piscibacillus salipiscarius]
MVSFIINGLFIANIRNNGVKVTEKQFPKIAHRTREIANNMGLIKVPDVFIIQSGGLLNAFATKFFGRNFVVLYSDIVEIIEQGNDEELEFIIAHELAHVKRRHVTKNTLLLPAMYTPFLGKAYSRACEYTCDRMAAIYTGNINASINALMILASGKYLYDQVNLEEYISQQRMEGGFFIWLSHITSTHPPLPHRIQKMKHISDAPEFYGFSTNDFRKEPIA